MYINDLPSFLSCDVLLYADDTTLVLYGKNLHQLFLSAQTQLDILENFSLANHLQLNPKKSKYMLFAPNLKHADAPYSIKLGIHELERVSYFKFLGFIVDESIC